MAYYQQLGGASSYLGAPKAAVHDVTGGRAPGLRERLDLLVVGDRSARRPRRALLEPVDERGVRLLGPLRDKWLAVGETKGVLCYPPRDITATADGAGR